MNYRCQALLTELHAMLEYIESFAKSVGFLDPDLGKIILVSEEVLVNIISYGYPSGPGMISIECIDEQGFIEIVIEDQGIAYNPLTHNEKEKKNVDKKGGFGIILVLEMMDEVKYSRIEDSNILKLIKLKNNS